MDSEREKLLFICSRNRWRSPTAERVFARSERFQVRSRGLSASAAQRLREVDIRWADQIFVMESEHKRRLAQTFRQAIGYTPVHVLDIEDEYQFMDPELVELIRLGVEAVVGSD